MNQHSPRIVIWRTAVGVVLYIVGVIGFYIYHLRSLPIAKKDPEPWGQFGDYIGGMLNPLFALLNVVVVIYLAVTIHQMNEAARRRKEEADVRTWSVIDLHREWNGESIYKSRTSAGKLVRKYPEDNYFQIEDKVAYEEAAHMWVVVGFFQRLSFMIQTQRVHEQVTRELFGELFVWWWIVSYERQLEPCDCDARDRMLELKKWLYDQTTPEQREPWVRRANRDLEAAIEHSKNPPVIAA